MLINMNLTVDAADEITARIGVAEALNKAMNVTILSVDLVPTLKEPEAIKTTDSIPLPQEPIKTPQEPAETPKIDKTKQIHKYDGYRSAEDKAKYEDIRERIRNTVLITKPNNKVPNMNEMAKRLRVSYGFVKRIYQELQNEYAIHTKRGDGSYREPITESKLRQRLGLPAIPEGVKESKPKYNITDSRFTAPAGSEPDGVMVARTMKSRFSNNL